MTASWALQEEPLRHPLAPGAAPRDIAAGLWSEDRERFQARYEEALGVAAATGDLEGLFEVLEEFRRLAVLQADPEAFRRSLQRMAELETGTPTPADEPVSVTRRRAKL